MKVPSYNLYLSVRDQKMFTRCTRNKQIGLFSFRIEFPGHPFYFASVPEDISQNLVLQCSATDSPARKSLCKDGNTTQAESTRVSSQHSLVSLMCVRHTRYHTEPREEGLHSPKAHIVPIDSFSQVEVRQMQFIGTSLRRRHICDTHRRLEGSSF